MANAACIDAHDYGMYGNYDISVFYISAVIDVNIDGDGSIKVYKGSGSTTIQADSAAGKYLYAASYLAWQVEHINMLYQMLYVEHIIILVFYQIC